MFSILTYGGQGSWTGRIIGIVIALALSAPIVAMWYFGDNLVLMMVDLGVKQNTPKRVAQRRVFEKSDIPGVVDVQILDEQRPSTPPR